MTVAVTELANGMRVVSHAMPHLETVSLGVWVGVGTRDENAREHGISHLLEHMAFKGTARRGARDIAEEIESVGGELNAATSPETTAYFARVLKDDVPLALDIIADILQSPRYDEAELAREKEVILQEIAAARDCPEDIAYDLMQEAAYPGQPLGRPIMGTAESVRGFAPADLHGYLKARYSPGVMVLSAAGAVDHDALVRLAEAAFSAQENQTAGTPAPARYGGGARSDGKPFEQSHVVLAFEAPSWRDEGLYAAQVLSCMLGGGMSSRLFQEARETRGLCYSIYSFCWNLSDTGLFGIHSATGEEQVPELLDLVGGELERIAGEAPPAVELDRAKAQLKAGLLMSLESSSARAEQLARQMLAFGRPLGVEELTGKVDTVSGEAVSAQAARLFGAAPVSVAVVGSPRWAGGVEALTKRIGRPAIEAAE